MEKIYLDNTNAVWVDSDYTTIYFDDPQKGAVNLDSSVTYRILRTLLKNHDNAVPYKALKESSEKTDTALQQNMNKLKAQLAENHIPFSTEIGDKGTCLILYCTPSTGGTGKAGTGNGSYTLYLPNQYQSIVNDLSEFYWDAYANIGARKNANITDASTNQLDLQAKLGEVYQRPQLISANPNLEWGWENKSSNNVFLIASNGFGKTTFLRALLLSCLPEGTCSLSDIEKEQFREIREYHQLSKGLNCLPLYVECKEVDFDLLKSNLENNSHTWIYHALGKRLQFYSVFDSEDEFSKAVATHLTTSAVFLLIDGYDEVRRQERKLLHDAILAYQKHHKYSSNLSVIIASRPLLSSETFIGFTNWYIAGIRHNESLIEAYIKAYVPEENCDVLRDKIINNPYLYNLIYSPSTLVWTIKTCRSNSKYNVCETITFIIEEVICRNNYEELSAEIGVYRTIYSELAYKYLFRILSSKGFLCNEQLFFSWIETVLDTLEEESRQVKLLRIDKSHSELEELFYTQSSLLEFDENYLRFSSPVFAYHLAANKIIYELTDSTVDKTLEALEGIHYSFRYKLIVVILSLGENYDCLDKVSDLGIRVRPLLANMFHPYLTSKLNDQNTIDAEKTEVLTAINEILDEKYGRNVFTGDGHNPSYKRSLEELNKH